MEALSWNKSVVKAFIYSIICMSSGHQFPSLSNWAWDLASQEEWAEFKPTEQQI